MMLSALLFSLLLYKGESKLINLDANLTTVTSWMKYYQKNSAYEFFEEAAKQTEKYSSRKPVGTKTSVVGVGSNDTIFSSMKYEKQKGLLETIFEAYARHYILVTTPEDWWFTIIRKVALDIDKVSQEKEVRDFFVSHQGKKKLVVIIGSSIYRDDYTPFFDAMA